MEALLKSVPEIENTSRRTGLELGLAQVTEAHRGDMTIKLKTDRTRSSDEIIDELRDKIDVQFPLLKVEFPQLLSDMIGDLTSSPEPIEVKLFSQDPAVLREWAPKLAASMRKIKGVVDVLDGIENTISGPLLTFKVDPSAVARAGLTPEEIQTDASALLQGAPAPNPGGPQWPCLHGPGPLSGIRAGVHQYDSRYAAGQLQRQDRDAGIAGRDSGTSRPD